VIEDIIENSGTPYFSFKDLDENKPTGSIKIRVETIDYFLKRYQETLTKKAEAAKQLEQQLVAYERSLRMPLAQKSRTQENIPIGFPHVAAEPEPATAAGDD
jgi:prefoldin subunit 5